MAKNQTHQTKVDMQELNKSTIVNVHFEKSKWYDIRLFIGTNLVKLGAWVAGFGYKVSEKNGQNKKISCKRI